MTLVQTLSLYGVIVCGILVGLGAQPTYGQASALSRTINVPLDYQNLKLGPAPLSFEFGAPFNKSKPTVFVIADGQQFYVRHGAVAQLQQTLFGDAFNVVGIITRGSTKEFIKATLDTNNQPDWARAWRIFNSDQWIEDIESIRREVLGDKGKVLLYGRSGGAYLVHQYLTKYGAHVLRAFTQSAVNPSLNRELGIDIERFAGELDSQDPNLQPMLREALARYPGDRIKILMALQRQHFYVPGEKLPAARAELIRTLASGDRGFYEQVLKEYEVDSIIKLSESPDIIPQDVRVLELIYPSGAFRKLDGATVQPLIETQYYFTRPLISLVEAGRIPAPAFSFTAAYRLGTEVFILAARGDEAVDYRTSIALASRYPRHQLFIADDNHVFARLTANGLSSRLLQSFLRFGLDSSELQSAMEAAEPYRWAER